MEVLQRHSIKRVDVKRVKDSVQTQNTTSLYFRLIHLSQIGIYQTDYKINWEQVGSKSC